jgi:hypothetical protein
LTQVLHDAAVPTVASKLGGSHYKWKLHTESDGIPAPTAMDLKSADEAAVVKDTATLQRSLHPDDAALLIGRDAMGILPPIT